MRSQSIESPSRCRTLLVGLFVVAMLVAGSGIVAASAGDVTTTLSPDGTSADVGETKTLDIVVDGAESDVGAYSVNVTVSETEIAEITAIDPVGEPLYEPSASVDADSSSATLEVVYGNESLVANETETVTVGTVTVVTTGAGTVTINQTMDDIGDADGESYTVTGSGAAELTVESTDKTRLDLDALEGNGTADEPYVVTNASGLQTIATDLSAYYELGTDIDASETAEWNSGNGFRPIGTDTAFTGSFDGAGYSINDLTVDRPNETNAGLFAELGDGATVENLTLQQATVSGDTFVGIVFGANEGGTVRDVSVQGTVDGSKDVGTVGGSNHETVTNVTATGAVTGSTDVGGLVGHNSVSGLVTKSSAAVTVDGTTRVGGLVGGAYGRISESAATGDVSGAHRVGGLAGNQVFGVINETYATGFVESANVDDTTAVAEPTAMGGLVGENNGGTLRNSYTIGSDGVNGSVDEGFIVGNVTLNGTVVDTYGELPTSNPDKGALTTEEMTGETAAETMAGFDFVETWSTTDGFPELIALDPELQQQPEAAFDIEPTTPKPNQAVTFTDLSTDPDGTIESRLWTFGDGTQSTEATPEHTYSSAGNYTVELTVTDNHGNTNSTNKTINVGVLDLPGAGSPDDPYIISNASELQAINQSSAAHYKLDGDIDAIRTARWNDGAGFVPIASFSGSFDGAGYAISGLTVDRPTKNGVGLFAAVDNTGTVKNVTLEDVAITGTPDAGGLVGDNSGTVTDTSVTGTVTDVDNNQLRDTGGLVGSNSGTITNSSANVTVSGGDSVGGLVGTNLGTVKQSSATGAVDGTESVGGLVGTNLATITETFATGKTTGTTSVGGLVGESIEDIGVPTTTTHSYWDTESTEQETSDGGTGLTTAEMTGETATETMSGFDFEERWETTDDYPVIELLSTEQAPPSVEFSYEPSNPVTGEPIQFIDQSSAANGTIESISWEFDDGSGSTEANTSHTYNSGGTYYVVLTVTTDDGTTRSAIEPVTVTHVISTASELQAVADDPDGRYRLGNDVDATQTANWNDGAGFEPIDAFSGSFDGAGYSIDGLTVDRPNTEAVGLFSTIEETGTVTNTTLTNVTVRGDRYVGGLTGDTRGSVERSHVSGTVEGSESVGGLLGLHINAGYVRQSSADAHVVGEQKIGGLIGFSANAEPVSQSFATGTVEGEETVGGLVGHLSSDSVVVESYAAGTVSGTDNVGGLTGDSISFGPVNQSYWDTESTTQPTSPGNATGLSTANMTGDDASENMTGFAFGDVWKTQPNEYPVLAWQSTSEDTPDSLDVSVSESPITAGDSVTVTVTSAASGTPVGGAEVSVAALDLSTTTDADGNATVTVDATPGEYLFVASADSFADAEATLTVEEPNTPDEPHPSGVSQGLFNAVNQNGGELTLGELRSSVDSWSENQQIGGVNATLADLRTVVGYWSNPPSDNDSSSGSNSQIEVLSVVGLVDETTETISTINITVTKTAGGNNITLEAASYEFITPEGTTTGSIDEEDIAQIVSETDDTVITNQTDRYTLTFTAGTQLSNELEAGGIASVELTTEDGESTVTELRVPDSLVDRNAVVL